MENIVQEIAAAEEQAAQIRAEATEKAQAILSAAEQQAEKLAKESEAERRAYRESAIAKAQADAEEAYKQTVASIRAEESARAEEVLSRSAELSAGEIVGRITGGSR